MLYIAVGFAAGLGAYFIWLRDMPNPVLEFSSVRDTFTDTSGNETAIVYFIRVKSYDSVQIRSSANYYVNQSITKPEISVSKRRTLLMHFFVEGDTAALSTDMQDELAYTHPEVSDPNKTLLLVPGGYVMKVVYDKDTHKPSVSELKRTSFFMARPGIHAKDLR